MRHLLLRLLFIIPVLALIALAQGAVSPALAACGTPGPACGDGIGVPCSCGDTVVTYTRLTGADPVLRTPCPFDGLFVASGVTLKINGTIQSATVQPFRCSGIALLPGAQDVVVTTGRIVGFDDGVEADGVTRSRFTRLQVVDCAESGIHVDGSNNVIEGNVITGCGHLGIRVEGEHNLVSSNRTEEGGVYGLAVLGSGNVVSYNLSQRNADDGIIIFGNDNSVNRNRSKYNGSNGFIIDGTDNTVTLNLAENNRQRGAVGPEDEFNGFEIRGHHNIVTRNRSKDNGQEGFKISGSEHEVTLNLAERNGTDGFTVFATDSDFTRNISAGNSGFGINEDPPAANNKYIANRCTSNGLLDPSDPFKQSDPFGLCP